MRKDVPGFSAAELIHLRGGPWRARAACEPAASRHSVGRGGKRAGAIRARGADFLSDDIMIFRTLLLAVAVGGIPAGPRAAPPADLAGAIALYDARHYAAAQRILERLAVVRPDDPEVNFRLGRIALWFDDEARGRAWLEQAARAAPRDARIQDALGDAYGLTAQRAGLLTRFWWARKCQAAYRRAVELDPQNPDYHWSLLRYCRQAPRMAGGGIDQAYAEAAVIRRLDPMQGRIAFATLDLDQKRTAQAFQEFEADLRRQPDDFMSLYQIGRCAAISGEQLDRGIQALRRCLQLAPPVGPDRPGHANVHYRLGNLLEKKGDLAGARAEYAAMARIDPDFRPAKDTLRN